MLSSPASHRAFWAITTLAAVVGVSAACGSSGSNIGIGNVDAGANDATSSCNDNGAIHASGTTWKCSCNTCSCDNGSMSTTLIACEEVDAGRDGEADASEASPPVCTQAISGGCTPNPPFLGGAGGSSVDFSNCPPTWNDAIAFCIANAGNFGFAETDCGAYRRWHVENVDVGCSYYYDATGGDSVAVFCTGFMGNTTCLGGPPGSTEPPCASLEVQDYRARVPSDELGNGGSRGDAASTD